jgi:putative phosphoribosyl transferase
MRPTTTRQTQHAHRFRDRADAGHELASLLETRSESHLVVLGLPRGGVPVAAEIARTLRAPLDVIVVQKLGVRAEPRLVLGAVGEQEICVLDNDVMARAGVHSDEARRMEMRGYSEVARRARVLRGGRSPVALEGRTVIIADDGIATGATARAALQVAHARGAARIVLAIPAAPPNALASLASNADEIVCLEPRGRFTELEELYENFPEVTDDDVIALLAATAAFG